MKKNFFKRLQIVFLIAGLVLFVYLIRQTGLDTLAHYLQMMGWGFVVIIALSAIRNYARAASLYYAIDPLHRQVNFFSLTNVMLAGEAIKYLTATGPFLSEPAKAAMVRRQIPMVKGVSSIAIENMIYYLSVFMFMLSGLPLFAWLTEMPRAIKITGIITTGSMVVIGLLTWFSVRRRGYILARMLTWIAKLTRRNFASVTVKTREVETNIYEFYEQRMGAFYLILALNLFAHLVNVVEVYLILQFMELPATVLASFAIETITKLINFVFFFVPTRAGVYESGNAYVLGLLGMTAGAGVALAIIRKIRAFVWVGYGLAIIGLMTFKDKPHERQP
ncbi:MAG: lysylphosphatidylglycerol synthase transmembrane domain-containing protein [Acidobacteriota bacterium]